MNFIIFNPDEMRADALNCYGNGGIKTPNINKLAEQGVRFQQAHVQHTVCTPSRCSFMTGLYPHNQGHRSLYHLLKPHEQNLLKYFKKDGYQVMWWGKNDLMTYESALESVTKINDIPKHITESFDANVKAARNPYEIEDPRYYSFLYETDAKEASEVAGHDWKCVESAIEYLNNKPEDPFVIYLPLGSPHCPYRTAKVFEDSIIEEEMPELKEADFDTKPDFYRLIQQYRRLDEIPKEHFKTIQKEYYKMVAYTDYLFGNLMKALEQSGQLEDTVILFFSDHGDFAGDYGLVEKWPSCLDDSLTRVPLIIKAPDCKKGHVVEEPVELFDIFATCMELANIEEGHRHFSKSLVPQLNGAKGDVSRAVFAEGGYNIEEPEAFERYSIVRSKGNIYYPKIHQQQQDPVSISRAVMIRTHEYKLIYRPRGQNELYDLIKDPKEQINQYNHKAYKEIQIDLEGKLLTWYIETADTMPFERDLRVFTDEELVVINNQ